MSRRRLTSLPVVVAQVAADLLLVAFAIALTRAAVAGLAYL